eukprot:SAG31_NODE_2201_length_6201_cov_14.443461_6_plen_86_part_01
MAGKKITGKLGEYEIVDDVPLGQGAEAAVYRGVFSGGTRREIAVKVQNQPQLPTSHTVIRRQGPRGSGHLEPIGIRIDASAARSSA